MRLLVIGGRLQGTEAVYLAGKAGHETVLADRHPAPPASGLADRHVAIDITADEAATRSLARTCDAILPAFEDREALTWLAEHAPRWGVPLLFDIRAYGVTHSKIASGRLFAALDIPRPRPWPACGYPAIVKPDVASGSESVHVVRDAAELDAARAALAARGHRAVVQEYVPGPSLSLEVLGRRGAVHTLQVTGLEFDAGLDCKRVFAPVAAAPLALTRLEDVAQRLARALDLQGIMDVEVIVRDGSEPVVLEIDARLPSQTPTAVFWSTGVNMVDLLLKTTLDGHPPAINLTPRRACVHQHIRVADGQLAVVGEHVLAGARPLQRVPGFFGADEALTDRAAGFPCWTATLTVAAATVAQARARATAVLAEIAAAENATLVPEQPAAGAGSP